MTAEYKNKERKHGRRLFKPAALALAALLISLFTVSCGGAEPVSGEVSDTEESIVFFGDSITYLCDWNALFPGRRVTNLGVSGDKVEDLLDRMGEVYAAKPTKLFIMVGVNDILSGRTIGETLLDWNRLLIRCEECGCEIFVQSVLPVSEEFGSRADSIISFDRALEQLANEHGAEYIDLYGLYSDGNGYLKKECTGDGLHLLREAYRPWAEVLEKYLND